MAYLFVCLVSLGNKHSNKYILSCKMARLSADITKKIHIIPSKVPKKGIKWGRLVQNRGRNFTLNGTQGEGGLPKKKDFFF